MQRQRVFFIQPDTMDSRRDRLHGVAGAGLSRRVRQAAASTKLSVVRWFWSWKGGRVGGVSRFAETFDFQNGFMVR